MGDGDSTLCGSILEYTNGSLLSSSSRLAGSSCRPTSSPPFHLPMMEPLKLTLVEPVSTTPLTFGPLEACSLLSSLTLCSHPQSDLSEGTMLTHALNGMVTMMTTMNATMPSLTSSKLTKMKLTLLSTPKSSEQMVFVAYLSYRVEVLNAS